MIRKVHPVIEIHQIKISHRKAILVNKVHIKSGFGISKLSCHINVTRTSEIVLSIVKNLNLHRVPHVNDLRENIGLGKSAKREQQT